MLPLSSLGAYLARRYSLPAFDALQISFSPSALAWIRGRLERLMIISLAGYFRGQRVYRDSPRHTHIAISLWAFGLPSHWLAVC